MSVILNQVTRLSQIIAVVLFVAVFAFGFYLGIAYDTGKVVGMEYLKTLFQNRNSDPSYTFVCDQNKSIVATFSKTAVALKLSDGRALTLPQAISASGVRYANKDESFVFWNKGQGAFVDESGVTTFSNCLAQK